MSIHPTVTRSVVTRASRVFSLNVSMLGDLRQFLRETEEIPGSARISISNVPQVIGPAVRVTITHEEDAN